MGAGRQNRTVDAVACAAAPYTSLRLTERDVSGTTPRPFLDGEAPSLFIFFFGGSPSVTSTTNLFPFFYDEYSYVVDDKLLLNDFFWVLRPESSPNFSMWPKPNKAAL